MKECVDSKSVAAKIIKIKKLKKDSSINEEILDDLVHHFESGNLILLPVDSIYALTGVFTRDIYTSLLRDFNAEDEDIIRIVSSFKMLDEVAEINKDEFDFLHRIWPDEVVVKLRSKEKENKKIFVRFPKNRYLIDILERLKSPLIHIMARLDNGKPMCQESQLVQKYGDKASLILIIKEFCRSHSQPSFIDISNGELEILKEGKIPVEEIQSLFFLNSVE